SSRGQRRGFADGVDHSFLRARVDAGPHRHREILVRKTLGLGKRAGLVAEESKRGLEVEGRHVVGRRSDLRTLQGGTDAIAFGRAAHEQVVDVTGLVRREIAELTQSQFRIAGGGFSTQLRPHVEPPEEDAQRSGLQLVEARVVADELEVDLVTGAVETEEATATSPPSPSAKRFFVG